MEIKDLFKELDLPDDIDSIDKFKETFHTNFVSRKLADSDDEIVSRIVGKRMGSIETAIKRELGIEGEEAKGKKVEELITLGATKLKTQLEQAKAAAPADVKEWESKLNTIAQERDQFKQLVSAKEAEFEGFKNEALTKEKNLKLNFTLNNIKSKIKWSETASEIVKKGFDAHINENYVFDFEDGDKLVVKGKDGNPIPNEKKTGFLSPEELFTLEAAKHNLIQLGNPTPPKPQGGGNPPPAPRPSASPYGDQPRRKLPKLAEEISAGK